jgi:glyoxylase-like metal-dependent hydrolase (beta-lactamase superfamily II)
VVLTHQHIDHTASVPRFAQADVWTTQAEQAAERLIGANRWRWSSAATRFRFVDSEGVAGETPWPGVRLTADGRLEAFATPGHTPGSVMLRLRADEGEVWFVGDLTFRTADLMSEGETSGIHSDVQQVRQLHRWLRERPSPVAILPAHDETIPAQLELVRHWQ